MIELFYADTPNGRKISIMLEEIKFGYKITEINLSKGDQDQRRAGLAQSPTRLPRSQLAEIKRSLASFDQGGPLIVEGTTLVPAGLEYPSLARSRVNLDELFI